MERPLPRCSFCRRTQAEVRLVAGPSDVYICNLCVALCSEILAHGAPPERTEPPPERSGRGPLIVTEVTSS